MPVKKNISSAEPGPVRRKKSSSDSKAKTQKNKKIPLKKVTRKEKARIQNTIESLPNLVIENSRVESIQRPINNSSSAPLSVSAKKISHLNPLSFRSDFEEKKKKIVWASVSTIMIFIFTLWVVNVRAQFTDADFHIGVDELLLNQAKEDFNAVFARPEPKPIPAPTQEQNVEKIKKILSENLVNMSTTSSSTTSTPDSTATSSAFVSSTKPVVELNNEPSFEE